MNYRIYKRRLAEFLVDNGCTLIKVTSDLVDPLKKNWIFEDTPLLHELMTRFTEQKGR